MLGACGCWYSAGEGDRDLMSGGEFVFPLRFDVFVFNAAYLDALVVYLVLVGRRPVGRFQYVCAPKLLSFWVVSVVSMLLL